ncbi:hypothetical protein Hte_003628 [Hypoxylon texense]
MSSHYASQYPPGYPYAPQTHYLTPQQLQWASRDPGFIGASFRYSPVSSPEQPTMTYTQEDHDNAMTSWRAAVAAAGYGSPNSTSTYSHYVRQETLHVRPETLAQDADMKAIQDADVKAVQDAGMRAVQDAGMKAVRDANTKAVRDADMKAVQDANTRAAQDAGTKVAQHVVQDACTRAVQDASTRAVRGANTGTRIPPNVETRTRTPPDENTQTESAKEEKSSSPSAPRTPATPRLATVEDGSEDGDETPENRGNATKKVSFAEDETIFNLPEAGDDEEKEKKKGPLPRIDEKDPFKEVKQTLHPMNEEWAEWPSSPAVYRRRDLNVNVKVSPDIESRSFEPRRPAPAPSGSGSRSRSGSYTRVSPPRASPSRVPPPPSEVPLSAPLPPPSRPKEPCATAPAAGGGRRPQSSGGPGPGARQQPLPAAAPRTADPRPQTRRRDGHWVQYYGDGRRDAAGERERERERERDSVRRQRDEMLRTPHGVGRAPRQGGSPHGSLDEALEELDRQAARPSFHRKRSDDSLHAADGSDMWESGSESSSSSSSDDGSDGSFHVDIRIPSDFGGSPDLRGETATFRVQNSKGVSYRLDLTHEGSPPPPSPPSPPPLERDWIRDRERRERVWEQEDAERKTSSKKEGKKRMEGLTDRLRNRFR